MTFSPVQYLEKIKQNHVSYLYVIYTPGQSVVSKQKDEMEKNERRAATARLLKMEKGNSKTFHILEMGNERKLFHINCFLLRKRAGKEIRDFYSSPAVPYSVQEIDWAKQDFDINVLPHITK